MVKIADSYEQCPFFEKTFSILGRKWNGLIIDVLLTEGPQRFKDLASKVQRCSDRVLVERLKELEEAGLVQKVSLEDSCRSCYCLTDSGEDLRDIMRKLHRWSVKWYDLKDC